MSLKTMSCLNLWARWNEGIINKKQAIDFLRCFLSKENITADFYNSDINDKENSLNEK